MSWRQQRSEPTCGHALDVPRQVRRLAPVEQKARIVTWHIGLVRTGPSAGPRSSARQIQVRRRRRPSDLAIVGGQTTGSGESVEGTAHGGTPSISLKQWFSNQIQMTWPMRVGGAAAEPHTCAAGSSAGEQVLNSDDREHNKAVRAAADAATRPLPNTSKHSPAHF